MPLFGTTAFAAPGLGVIAALLMSFSGMVWLNRRSASAGAAGEGYGEHADSLPVPDTTMREHAQGQGFDIAELPEHQPQSEDRPPCTG
jgi:hypothetical protein